MITSKVQGLALAVLTCAMFVPFLSAVAQEPVIDRLEPPALVEALQEGGLVLLIRHERTEVPSREDDFTAAPDDCTSQRNLSIAGAAGAQETGFSLRALGIPVDQVMTSPMCRAAETARYMFGPGYELEMRLMHHVPGGVRNFDVALAEARGLLAEIGPGQPDANIALISHGGTVRGLSGLRLNEGEIAVLRLDEQGNVTTLGDLTGSQLGSFARTAIQRAN